MNDGNSPKFGEILTSLILPDPIDFDRFHEVFYKEKSLEPEKFLMLAILEDAVDCYQKYSSAQDAREYALFRNAEGWILDESKDWLFSFESICDVLEFDPEYVRQGLLCWKQMKLKGNPKFRYGSRSLTL